MRTTIRIVPRDRWGPNFGCEATKGRAPMRNRMSMTIRIVPITNFLFAMARLCFISVFTRVDARGLRARGPALAVTLLALVALGRLVAVVPGGAIK